MKRLERNYRFLRIIDRVIDLNEWGDLEWYLTNYYRASTNVEGNKWAGEIYGLK